MRKTIYSRQNELVAKTIRNLREKAGLTSRDLSRQLGKGHSFISNCEQGQRRVDLAEFFWICKACGASAATASASLMRGFEAL